MHSIRDHGTNWSGERFALAETAYDSPAASTKHNQHVVPRSSIRDDVTRQIESNHETRTKTITTTKDVRHTYDASQQTHANPASS